MRTGLKRSAAGLAGSTAAAVAIGIPTDLIANPWFTRMTPVRPLDDVFWVVTSVLMGALASTYVEAAATTPRPRAGLLAPVLGVVAAGCPVCNKLVVALLGTSGALSVFAPLQPLLGALGVVAAAWSLFARLRPASTGCAVPPSALHS